MYPVRNVCRFGILRIIRVGKKFSNVWGRVANTPAPLRIKNKERGLINSLIPRWGRDLQSRPHRLGAADAAKYVETLRTGQHTPSGEGLFSECQTLRIDCVGWG